MKQPKITARKRSCGKIMFSQVSVCSRGNLWYHVLSGVGWVSLAPGPLLGWVCQGVGTALDMGPQERGEYLPPNPNPLELDTTRYGRQVGDTHPTGMLSCYPDIFALMNVKGIRIKGNVFEFLSSLGVASSLVYLTYSNFNIRVHAWNIICLEFVPSKIVNSKRDVVEYPV